LTLTNDAKTAVALTTRLGSPQRPSLTPKMWHEFDRALRDAGYQPVDVFDKTFDLSTVPGVSADLRDRILRLTSDAGSAMLEVDELNHRGIWTTTMFDDGYPHELIERLGHNAPPVLFGSGNIGLISKPGIGIVGSRDVTEEGADAAKALARKAVSLGMSVVSGAAKGVDQLAMNAAFSDRGTVVGVLADSLIGRIRRPDTLQALDEGTVCLLTQQAPSSGFTPAAAMARNKIVYALSALTVVVASDEGSGGTWSGATEALRAENGTVAVWRGQGEGPGNEALEKAGALPIRDPSELSDLLDSDDKSEQMSLDWSP
jgi:predicted Rossmann fold nucleotide-binding protein DprA/Smf involved in DNA uptake